MNAYVAVTDAEWFDFLARQEDTDEVNCWQPKPWGGELGVLQRGEPLLFKLKAPLQELADLTGCRSRPSARVRIASRCAPSERG